MNMYRSFSLWDFRLDLSKFQQHAKFARGGTCPTRGPAWIFSLQVVPVAAVCSDTLNKKLLPYWVSMETNTDLLIWNKTKDDMSLLMAANISQINDW